MLQIKFIIIVLSIILQSSAAKSARKITVMLSKNENRSIQPFERLERKIIDNFAKKLNLGVEYIMANEVLNVAFNSEDSFEQFHQSIENL